MAEFKIPATFGACADRLYALRALKKPLRDKLNKLDEEETAIEQHLIATMPKSDGGGIGKKAQAQIVVKQEPTVEDRAALQKYIVKTGAFELLQGKLAAAAVRERWDLGEKVPGVGSFAVHKVSVTKR